MAKRYQNTLAQASNNSGNSIANATLTFYESGTSTFANTYSDNALTSANTNPVVSDGNGRFGDIFLQAIDYRVVLKDAAGVVLDDQDPYDGRDASSDNVVGTIAALKALSKPSSGTIITVAGYYAQADGGEGQFVYNATSTATANDGTIIITDAGGAGRWERLMFFKPINVRMFGAKGDGVNDDTTSIQSAIDYAESLSGGELWFPAGDFRVSKTQGTNDSWGIKIDSSYISIKGEAGSSLRRLNPDISTYALAFPILFIGVADSNVAAQTVDVRVEGITFIGENTQHSTGGSALHDGRYSIECKNTKGVIIDKCRFQAIDSSAVWYQTPAQFDYVNSVYYNTTKNYNSRITNNEFVATSHAVAGRGLIHAVVGVGIDGLIVSESSFVWCDNCISTETTYDNYTDKETDTYTDSNLAVLVKRTGRGHTFSNNYVYNSSEHSVYTNGMATNVSGNTIVVDDITICNTSQIKTNGRSVVVSGNVLSGVGTAIESSENSSEVTIDGNSIQAFGDSAGGIIQVSSFGLTSYRTNRSDYLSLVDPQRNITVSNNTVYMNEASQTSGVFTRVLTDNTDANYPDGQLQSVLISNNTVHNAKCFLYMQFLLAKGVRVVGNTAFGKPFTEAGFSGSTTMNSTSFIFNNSALTTVGRELTVEGNQIYGFEAMLEEFGGSAGAGTLRQPRLVQNNQISYMKTYASSKFAAPINENIIRNNSASYLLDRTTWFANNIATLDNQFSSGFQGDGNPAKKSMTYWDGTNLVFYPDDTGAKTILG